MKKDFDFEACAAWTREKAAALALAGVKVETLSNELVEKTILVKASHAVVEGVLVVWERGRVNMSVFSFTEKEIIFDQDIEISANDYAENMSMFFRLLEKS